MNRDSFRYKLCNPMDLPINNIDPEPRINTKIKITDWSAFNVNETVELSKLSYLTVDENHPIVVGNAVTGYNIKWEIIVKESPSVMILPWHYKII